jgi:hypothetical protein
MAMALPLPRDPIPSFFVTPSDTASIGRALGRLIPDDVIGVVRHPRENTGD